MKKKIFITIILIVLALSISTISRADDFLLYTSVEEMKSEATDIVRVEVLEERVELLSLWGDEYFPHTIHQLRVLEVFQGNTQVGEVIDVRQFGGQVPNTEEMWMTASGILSFEIGSEVVLFLRRSTVVEDYTYIMLNPVQGAYRINANGELESFRRGCDLRFTIRDLREYPIHKYLLFATIGIAIILCMVLLVRWRRK